MDLANVGQLQERFLTFRRPVASDNLPSVDLSERLGVGGLLDIDYNHDGKSDRLAEIDGGGSCSGLTIVDLNAAKDDIWSYFGSSLRYTNDSDENIRWASWGRLDRLLIVDGEPIIVTSRNWQSHADISLASWMGRGVQLPLCAFEFSGSVKNSVIPIGDRPICGALVAGEVEVPAWSEAMHLSREAQAGLHDYYDAIRTADIDLDQDGDPERIAELSYASGAGCGSDHRWFKELEAAGMTAPETPLNHVLGVREWGVAYRQARAETSPLPDLFMHDGKAYLLGETPTGHTGVYSFENATPHLRCEVDRIAQIHIVREYSVGS
jgi:hypothetical protein